MKALVLILAAFLPVAGATAASHNDSPARLLAGRTAGAPEQCINQSRILDTQTFDDGSIYYRMGGGTDYVNRPRGCSQLNSDRVYVTVTPSTQLCSGDIMRVYDSGSRIPFGSCAFDQFIPYPKAKRR